MQYKFSSIPSLQCLLQIWYPFSVGCLKTEIHILTNLCFFNPAKRILQKPRMSFVLDSAALHFTPDHLVCHSTGPDFPQNSEKLFQGSSRTTKGNYHFFPANQQLASTKIYSSTRYSISKKRNRWHNLVGNKQRNVLNCLNQYRIS